MQLETITQLTVCPGCGQSHEAEVLVFNGVPAFAAAWHDACIQQDERERARAAEVERNDLVEYRLNVAGVPMARDMRDFPGDGRNLGIMDALAKHAGVFLHGGTGSYKTMWAVRLARKLVKDGFTLAWVYAKDFGAQTPQDEIQKEAARLRAASIIVIDDLYAAGQQKKELPYQDFWLSVIDRCYANDKKFVVTAALPPGKLASYLGESLARRLSDRVAVIDVSLPTNERPRGGKD